MATLGFFDADSLRLRCRIAPSAYFSPAALSGKQFVYLVVVAAHPVEPYQFANVRSKHRSDLAKTIAEFARMTVEDSRKLLPSKFYPSWVVFTKRQKLNWLNTQLRRIWPHVDEAASELIRTIVEPILEQYRLIILSSLTFSKLTLGTVAPQFTGVTIVEEHSGPDGVTMDLEIQWDGNSNIVLDIKTRVGVGLPVRVKDIGFTWGF
ncbi:unnamed protein product [Sphenostylis stenocarpa]|uniref:SMP-LTD domain-containing protein n=1 Tax=Sphenostylis stenocarpa TaxID=92480 RepID=A0AA86T542_9FABA|nr:unnamed protein product [Sphenostylis stenocarpa]